MESGEHLWNCLAYVDMKMVRAGQVAHPGDWRWCGYREVAGLRRRYRILDRECLAEKLEARDFEEIRDPSMLTVYDAGHSQNEGRWISMGISARGRLLVVCHTFEEETPGSGHHSYLFESKGDTNRDQPVSGVRYERRI